MNDLGKANAPACPRCGQYTCTCPAGEVTYDDETYALADDPPAPEAGVIPVAAVATSLPPPLDSPAPLRPIAYKSAPPKPARASADPEQIKNLYLPLWLLGGGVVIGVVAAFIRRQDLRTALIEVGVELVGGTILMLAGIFVTAKIRDIEFGEFWVAVYKLAAVAVAPSALGALLEPLTRMFPLGFLANWLAQFVLYFALLGVLFDLDEPDTWACVFVIFLVKVMLFFLVLSWVYF
jgi:hypothetical protein